MNLTNEEKQEVLNDFKRAVCGSDMNRFQNAYDRLQAMRRLDQEPAQQGRIASAWAWVRTWITWQTVGICSTCMTVYKRRKVGNVCPQCQSTLHKLKHRTK